MRQWRVGSISMGLALVLLGIALLLTSWQKGEAFDILLRWWPVICILLGLEVLLYLFLSKQEHPVLRYDLFSMFIVAVIGISCVGFAALSSTGLVEEIRHETGARETTMELADLTQNVPEHVTAIVVQSFGIKPEIDTVKTRELHVFGTYRSVTSQEAGPEKSAQAAAVRTVGDTMYVTLLEPPSKRGLSSYRARPDITMTVPEGLAVDIRGAGMQ
jgi:cytochrome c biogenesis factor